jgi:hypothetical protein
VAALSTAAVDALVSGWLDPSVLTDLVKLKTVLTRAAFMAILGGLLYLQKHPMPLDGDAVENPQRLQGGSASVAALGVLLAVVSVPRAAACLVGGLVLVALVVHGKKAPPPTKWLVLLLALSYPWDARAADDALLALGADGAAPTSKWSTEGSSWAGTLISNDGTRTPVFAARIEGRWRSGPLTLAARLDALAEKAGVDIQRPDTYTNLEGWGLASFRLYGPGSIAVAYGLERPAIGLPGEIRHGFLAGVLVGTKERWLLVGVGERQSISEDLCGLAAWRIGALGKTALTGDVAARLVGGKLTYVARTGVQVTLWGEP